MNRVEMAKMLWKRAAFPVKAALTACALLRGMVRESARESEGRGGDTELDRQTDLKKQTDR